MIYGLSNVGKKRAVNEDSFYFERFPKGYVMIVSDGMGGHNAGDVASRLAISSIREFMEKHDIFSDPEIMIRQAVSYANEKIFTSSLKKVQWHGMGATLVMAVVRSQTAFVANVGDSRAYLISKNKISQITRDHSYVYELVKNGIITEEEAKTHPRRNEILKALGIAPEVYPDIFSLEIIRTDKLLLCTDGLTSQVDDSEILSAVNKMSRKASCEELVRLANERGGPDNITVVIS